MHGQNREAYKAKARDQKVSAARAKKALQWNESSNQILAQHKRNTGRGTSSLHRSHSSIGGSYNVAPSVEENELSGPTMIVQTGKMLLINPDPLYLWNIRRDVLITGPHSFHGAAFNLDQELKLTTAALENNPKAYGAWLHRKWSVRHYLMVILPSILALDPPQHDQSKPVAGVVSSSTLLSSELNLCGKLLSLDERNFHCWNYRRFIVSCRGYVIMKRHAHSCLFLQQATEEDCSDFYFVRNYAEHPYSTKFAMDGNWKMWTDYIQYNFSEHLQVQKEAQRQKMITMSDSESKNSEVSTSSGVTSLAKRISSRGGTGTGTGRHKRQGSGGSLSHLHCGGGLNKGDGYNDRGLSIRNMFTTLMGPQLTPLTYTNIGDSDNNPHAADEEIPVTKSSDDSILSEDLLTPPRLELVNLLRIEWDFTTQKIQDNFSNCSAFHYRSKLIPLYSKYCYEPSSTTDETPLEDKDGVFKFDDVNNSDDAETQVITGNVNNLLSSSMSRLLEYFNTLLPLAKGELDLIQQAIYTEPDDQTPWWYHHFLLNWIQPPSITSLISSSGTSGSGQNQSRQQQQRGTSLSLRKEDEHRILTAHKFCVATYRQYILEHEIAGLEELLEAEDGQLKWAWTALHTLYGLILKVIKSSNNEGSEEEDEEVKFREKRKECIGHLLELDPDRKGRYLDMMDGDDDETLTDKESSEDDR